MLKGLRGTTADELESDIPRRWAIFHGLQLAIECVQDIAAHLVASRRLGKPTNHTDTIDLLGHRGVIPTELAARIRGMPGFRNVIVHEYLEVDLARVVDALAQLEDFEEFSRQVHKALD